MLHLLLLEILRADQKAGRQVAAPWSDLHGVGDDEEMVMVVVVVDRAVKGRAPPACWDPSTNTATPGQGRGGGSGGGEDRVGREGKAWSSWPPACGDPSSFDDQHTYIITAYIHRYAASGFVLAIPVPW